MDESDIISGMRQGDRESFIKVVDLYKKKILNLCYSYTRDYQEAEDLSQEVFISLYKGINNFRCDCSLSTYIYRITISRCIDFKRKKSIKNFLTGLIAVQKEEESDLDEKNYIRECVYGLPEKLKTPTILFYYADLTQKEIADILDVPVKTVEGRIYRAKQRLKMEFEKGGYGSCSEKETI